MKNRVKHRDKTTMNMDMGNNFFSFGYVRDHQPPSKIFKAYPHKLYFRVTLTDLLDHNYLIQQQKIANKFTGMSQMIVDAWGRALNEIYGDSDFCKILRGTRQGLIHRTESERKSIELARKAKAPAAFVCEHTGLVTGSAPVYIGERIGAYWTFGQFTMEKLPRERITAYAAEVGVEPEALWQAYERIPVLSKDEFNHHAELVFVFASQVSEMAYLQFCLSNDPVFNIPSRDDCEAALSRSLKGERGGSGFGVAMCLDIDDFKIFNDTFGSNFGEILINHVYETTCRLLPENCGLYRFGLDEFFVIWDGAYASQAKALAEKLLAEFRKPVLHNDVERYFSLSIGMAIYPDHGPTVEEVFKSIDIAMYRAKNYVKGQALFFSRFEGDTFDHRAKLEERMRHGLSNDFADFVLYYQPIVSMTEQNWVGAEALIRWDDPELGMMYPDQFIRLAEYLGIMTPMSDWVLRTACRQCLKWHQAGFKDFKISINMSISHLLAKDLVKRITGLLDEIGLDPRFLILEIPETIELQKLTIISNELDSLRNFGIGISMDDFGTGCASLSNLRTMPLDFIKIDKSFMLGQPNVFLSKEFLQAMIDLMHSMNLKICAEGIEDGRWLDQLADMKCDMLQGYLFARPMPAEDFTTLLESNPSNLIETLGTSSSMTDDDFFDQSIFEDK